MTPPRRRAAWSDVGSLPTLDSVPTGADKASAVGAALHLEEVTRTRLFLRVVFVLVAVTMLVVPFLPGDRLAEAILLGSAGVCAVGCLLFHAAVGRPGGYTEGRLLAFILSAELAVLAGTYYFGVLSAAPIGFVLGISVFGLAESTRVTRLTYGVVAVGYGALSALVITGVVADRGLLPAAPLGVFGGLVIVAVVEAFMAFSYLQARLTRRTTLEAIDRLERAVRAVAQRDAVLLEARQELERALGGPGRFTEQTLGGWRLGPVIGRGAMGEVYQAESLSGAGTAAIKLLHRNLLTDSAAVTRFVREAKAAARLDSPHVVRVLAVSDADAPLPYLAMERLEGHDLAHHLRTERRFRPERVVGLVAQVAAGLEAARAAGIVHRDLKPHNIFLDEGEGEPPVWKILDFGMSKLLDQQATLTRGQVIGTPAFMAPEQARGDEIDHRADVYALAAVAYRALTGTLPFPGEDVISVLHAVTHRMPVRPGLLASLSDEIDAVLALGLAKRADERFATATELAEALAAAVRGDLPVSVATRAAALLARHPWAARSAD